MLGGSVHVTHSLRFTSGVAPADLFATNVAAEPFSSKEPLRKLLGMSENDLHEDVNRSTIETP